MAISKVKLPDNTVQPIKDNVTPRMYLGTCPTAAATVNKVVTVEDFPLDSEGEPLIGTLIGVKFTNTNSATAPKLNVNEIGAKSIYYNSAEATSTSSVYGGSASRYTYYVWDGTYWAWVTHGTDNNDNTLAYNVRYNSASKTTIDKFARYRILFTSADDKHWVPANTSTSTNATASRTVNQTPINPFGQIVYYGSTTAISAGGTPGATVLYTQYALTFGYSFNRTGAALTLTTKAPVYIKCAPQSNGSAIIDADTPYVQSLPSTEDGKIYIYLGIASSATAVEMSIVHPVYYYKDGVIRPWTNAVNPEIPEGLWISGEGENSAILAGNEDSEASGNYAVSEGYTTFANGNYSHAEGILSEATGVASHAEGSRTTAQNDYEHSEGRFNISNKASTTFGNAGNTLHSIGIGSSNANRANALEIMQNGDAYLKGVGTYDGTTISGASTLQTVINSKYEKPSTGIPASDLASGVIPSVPEEYIIHCNYAWGGGYIQESFSDVYTAAQAGKKIVIELIMNYGESDEQTIVVNSTALIPQSGHLIITSDIVRLIDVAINYNYNNAFVLIEETLSTWQSPTSMWWPQIMFINSSQYYANFQPDWNITNTTSPQFIQNKPTIPSNVVQYTAQTLTDAQKSQARTNIGASALGDDILVINNDPPHVSGTIQQTNFATLFGITEQEVYLIFSGKKTKLYYENPNTGSAEGTTWYTYFVLCTQMDELSSYRSVVLEYGSGRCQYWSLAYDSSEYYDIDVLAEPAIPTISTNIQTDKASDFKTASPKAVYDEVHPAVQTTQPQGGFLPNVEYNLGTLTGNVTFALAAAVSGITNHYFWTFMTGSTAPSITWPSGIAWNGGSAPTINAQKYYEISILNNRAVWIETDLLGGIQDDPDI